MDLIVQELAGQKALAQQCADLRLGSGGADEETTATWRLMTDGELIGAAATAESTANAIREIRAMAAPGSNPARTSESMTRP